MTYLVAAIVAMTNMCGVVTVDTCRARVVSYVPEGGDEILAAPEAGATGAADDGEFEFVGVNRVGDDPEGIHYSGFSQVISAKGETLSKAQPDTEAVMSIVLDYDPLQHFREKFPVGKDWDSFRLPSSEF